MADLFTPSRASQEQTTPAAPRLILAERSAAHSAPLEAQHLPGTAGEPIEEAKDGNGGFKPNPGYCPAEVAGKRVRVRLAHGGMGTCDDNPMSPPGWAADGKDGCRWTRTGSRFDIAEYEVIR